MTTPLPDATPEERRAALRRGRSLLFLLGSLSVDYDPTAYWIGTEVWELIPSCTNERLAWEAARALVNELPESEIEGMGESLPNELRTQGDRPYANLMTLAASILLLDRPEV